jgi:hypothetical protein
MSRGPGVFQRRVLECLAGYHRLRGHLGWTWPAWSRYSLGTYVWDEHDIERYEAGDFVPLWMLRRDLGCSKDELSRALRSLYRKNYVWIFTGDLHFPEERTRNGCNAKYARITDEGLAWLSANTITVTELADSG